MKNILFSFFILLNILFLCIQPSIAQDSKENAEFKMALNLYKDGIFDLAKEQLQIFIQKYPTTQQGIEARYYLGVVLMKQKNFIEAKNVLQNMAITFSDHPKAPDAWWSVGEAFAGMKNYKEAASAFERVRTFHPKHLLAPQALLEASTYYQLAGMLENSGVMLRAILQEYPNSTEVMPARYALGKLYTATNNFDRAFSELNRVAEGTTNQELKAKAITAIGVLHGLIGYKDEAEKKLREVITLYAKTNSVHEAYVRLGDLQRLYQNFVDATQSYNMVANNVQADPAIREESFIGAAECASAGGDYNGALKIYENFFEAFKGHDISASTYLGAAKAARDAGEFNTASRYYNLLLSDTLSSLDRRIILKHAALNEHDGNNLNGSLQYFQKYILEYPNDTGVPDALFAIASIYEKDFHNYSRAISTYNTILDRYSASRVADDAQFARARALHASKKLDDALEAYHSLMEQYPASEFVREAEKEIEHIRHFEQIDASETTSRIANALEGLANNEPSSIDVALGEIFLKDLKNVKTASKYFEQARKKGASGQDGERALYGLALCEIMRLKKNEGSISEAERLLNEFIKNYPNSVLRDEAAYQRFLLRSFGKQATDIILAANDFLALNPKEHADEVSLARVNTKRESGKMLEAESDYTALITAKGEFTSDALYGRGVVRMNASNFSAATTDLHAYLSANPNGKYAPHALLTLAKIAERSGEYLKAASLYEDVTNRYGYSSEYKHADIQMVKVLSDGSYHDRAVVRAAALLQKEKDNPFSSDETIGDYMFAYAEALAKKKNITRAKQILQEYQSSYPKGKHTGEVYYALGLIYKDEGKIALATSYLQQSGASSGNTEATRDAADLLLESDRYDEAIREYRRLAEKAVAPQEKAYYESRIVVAYYRANNTGEAQVAMNAFKTKYPDAEPNFDEFELERGKNFFRQKKYKEAIDVFDEIESSKTSDIAALAMLWIGKSYEGMNQNQKAIEQFNKVITGHAHSSAALEAYLSMGRMALRAEQWQEAAKNFKLVVDQPNVPPAMMKEALNGLISAYSELNIADGAIEMTKRFIALYPTDPTIFRKRVNLGSFYQTLGHYDPAITHFESLLGEATSDDQAEIRYYIGECYFGRADYKQAIIEFLKVPYLVNKKTEIDWKATAYHSAGLSYEKLGQYDKAIYMYEIIKSSPDTDGTFKAAAEKDINRVKALLK